MPTVTPAGPPVPILILVESGDEPQNEQYENATAELAGGGRVVAWIDFTDGHVKYLVFNAAGGVLGSGGVTRFADLLPGEKRAPFVVPNEDGTFDIFWTYTSGAGVTSIARRMVTFDEDEDDNGIIEIKTSGAETLVPVGGLNSLVTGSAAPLPGGGNVLFYESAANAEMRAIIAQFQEEYGGAPITASGGGQNNAPVAIADDEGFWGVWRATFGTPQTVMQQFDLSGVKIGSQIVVGGATANAELGPDAAFLDNGDFVVTFVREATGGGQELVGRVYNSATGLQPDFIVASLPNGIQGVPAISPIAGNGFIVSWIANNPAGADALLGRAYDANGATPVPFGAAFTIADSARFQISSGVTRLNDGQILFTWDGSGSGDSQGVFQRIFQVGDFGNVPTGGNDELWDGPPGSTNPATIGGLGGNDIIRGYGGNDILDGADGNDSLFGGSGDDLMVGGPGNDFGLINQLLDSFVGGSGIDTAGVQGNFIGTLGIDASTEVVLVASGIDTRFGDYSGSLYDYEITLPALNLPPGQRLTIQAAGLLAGEDLILDASLLQGVVRVFGGAGVTSLVGGAGSDGAFFGNPAAFNPANVISLGGNVDTLAFRGNYVGGSALALNAGQLGGVDVIGLLSGLINPFGGFIEANGFDYDLTLPNGILGAGATIDVNANTLGANESVDVDASAVQVGSVRFFLGAGADVVAGSANGDLFFGNLGADLLDGGLGGDTYVYRNVLDSTAASQDIIALGAGDRIDLSFIDAILGTPGVNDAFTFIGSAAFGNIAGQLRLGVNVAQGDIDGDGVADLVIGFTGTPPIETDFNL